MTAAAAIIDASNPKDREYLSTVSRRSSWNTKPAWKWYKRLGEIHYSVNRTARVAGFADLFLQRRRDDGEWERVDEGPLAEFVRDQIYSPFDGRRGLIERFYTLRKVPADSYLIRVRDSDGDPTGFQFLSANEIDMAPEDSLARLNRDDGIKWITLPAATGAVDRLVREVQDRDMMGRMWAPGYPYVEETNTPLTGLDLECDILDTLTRTIKAKLMSRFAMAGMMFIPSEIGEAKVAGKPGVSNSVDIMDYLAKAMSTNMTDWDTAQAWARILLRGPGNAGEQIKEFTSDRMIDETDIRLRAEMSERILFGMDVQQQAVSGSEEISHWGTWNQSDEERRIAVQPDLEYLCFGLDMLVVKRQAVDLGMSAEEINRHRLWYDLDAASVRTNAQEDTRQAFDRGVANREALKRRTGLAFDETMEGDEFARWVGLQMKNPKLALHGIKTETPIDWEDVLPEPPAAKPGPGVTSPGDKQKTGPGVGDPGSPNGAKRSTPKRATPA